MGNRSKEEPASDGVARENSEWLAIGDFCCRGCSPGLEPVFPIAGAPTAMGNGQDLNHVCFFTIDHNEWEARQLDPSRAARSQRPALRSFHNLVNHLIEFFDKSCCGQGAALAIPSSRRLCFLDGGGVKKELCSGHSIVEENRRRASSRETSLTLPESTSAMRRAISWSQASATESSSELSRLSIREPARSARSATERESAFFSSSVASWLTP